jgi:NAD(P)H-nitrite reductase large subunit
VAEQARQYVIVGNGVAGTTCAETLRKNDPSCTVTLIGNERYPLYNRVALPPYLKNRTPEQKVLLRTVEQHAERGITLMLETQVAKVDTDAKLVLLDNGTTLPYDALLVATGGRPNPLTVQGAEGVSGIYNFQYFDEAKAIHAHMERAHTAVVVGGSFIAYELAEAFRHHGLRTIWLIRGPYWLRRVLDEDGGALVDEIARAAGVEPYYGEELREVRSTGGAVSGVVTKKGDEFETQMIGVGLGLTMNAELLASTGVEVKSGIVTDECLQSSVPNVYAAGDIAEFCDVVIQRHNQLGTWGNAQGHGRVTAMNMSGRRTVYEDVPMYSSTLFDSYIRVIGLTPELFPDLEASERLDVKSRSYQRLFFLDNRLVGAVLIGDMKFRARIFSLIKERTPVPPSDRAHLLEG